MSDTGQVRVSLAGRLAARALTLALDAANARDDVVDHLLRLARGDAAALDRAAEQVERRHHHPESATAQLAIRSLRTAASVAVGTETPAAEREGRHGVMRKQPTDVIDLTVPA